MPSATNNSLTFQSAYPNQMFGILKSKKTSKLSKHESVFCLTSMPSTLQFSPKKPINRKKCNGKSSSTATTNNASPPTVSSLYTLNLPQQLAQNGAHSNQHDSSDCRSVTSQMDIQFPIMNAKQQVAMFGSHHHPSEIVVGLGGKPTRQAPTLLSNHSDAFPLIHHHIENATTTSSNNRMGRKVIRTSISIRELLN